MLTSHERLTRLFAGQEIDRCPVWLLFPYFRSAAYADIWKMPLYDTVLPEIYARTDTIERYDRFDMGFCGSHHPDIKQWSETRLQNGEIKRMTTVSCGEITLTKSIVTGEKTILEPFVKEPDDLLKILQMPYESAQQDYTEFRQQEKELGEHGLMGINLIDPLSYLHSVCSETGFIMIAYEEPEIVDAFLEEMTARCLNQVNDFLDHDIGQVFWISGAEFATPPMLPPSCFDRMVVRHTKKICEAIHSRGKYTLIHCHGKIGRIISGLRDIGMDALHPIEPPPMGDCTLKQARAVLGDTILIGNLQYGDLFTASKEETAERVQCAIKEGSSGRFILSISGGPSASYITQKVIDNYLTILEITNKDM